MIQGPHAGTGSQASGWRTFGHPGAVRYLARSVETGRLAHAYLITGPAHVGKRSLALDLARAVNCEPPADLFGEAPAPPCGRCAQCERIERGLHADVRVIAVETAETGDENGDGESPRGRKNIGIDQIRALLHDASLKPFEGRRRVFIIDGAELMTQEAANAFLKTLEEPADDVLMALLAASTVGVPETIVSRCQRVDLRPVPPDVTRRALMERFAVDDEALATQLARLARGCPGTAVSMLADPTALDRRAQALLRLVGVLTGNLEERFRYARDLAGGFRRDREPVAAELDLWREWWRDVLLIKHGLRDAVTNAEWSGALEAVAGTLEAPTALAAAKAVEAARNALNANATPRLALEVLMLDLPPVPAGAVPEGIMQRSQRTEASANTPGEA